jgi:hypothetical protein
MATLTVTIDPEIPEASSYPACLGRGALSIVLSTARPFHEQTLSKGSNTNRKNPGPTPTMVSSLPPHPKKRKSSEHPSIIKATIPPRTSPDSIFSATINPMPLSKSFNQTTKPLIRENLLRAEGISLKAFEAPSA